MTKEQKYKAFFEAIERLNRQGCSVKISPEIVGVKGCPSVVKVQDGHHHLDDIAEATNWLNSIKNSGKTQGSPE